MNTPFNWRQKLDFSTFLTDKFFLQPDKDYLYIISVHDCIVPNEELVSHLHDELILSPSNPSKQSGVSCQEIEYLNFKLSFQTDELISPDPGPGVQDPTKINVT